MPLARGDPRPPGGPAGRGMGDHVNVDAAGLLDGAGADPLVKQACPSRSPRCADDELRGVHLAGEVQQRGGHVVADHGVHGRTEACRQLADPAQLRRGHPRQAVATDNVNHHQLGAGLRRDPRCPSHQRLRLRAAGHGDDDAFPRLPRGGDLFVCAVLLQGRINLVGQPQQRDLAQRGQIARAEVVRQRGIDPFGCIDVAVSKPAPQRFRCDVDQLDLIGRADDLVGDLLLLLDAGDLLHDIV
ncbi:Uncharacterised protein [Mycobacterium tuberculosis]|nr:Uncharacterised protein [Mycobacterium tuberculosis]